MNKWVLRVKYSPDQPRVPAGSSEGGQWTSEGSGGGQGANITSVGSDAEQRSWRERYGRTADGRRRSLDARVGDRVIATGSEGLSNNRPRSSSGRSAARLVPTGTRGKIVEILGATRAGEPAVFTVEWEPYTSYGKTYSSDRTSRNVDWTLRNQAFEWDRVSKHIEEDNWVIAREDEAE